MTITGTNVTKRPMPFTGSMVRALLDDLKTKTRRIMNPQPEHSQIYNWKGKRLYEGESRRFCWKSHVGDDPWLNITMQLGHACPYGVPGDRLWVKEAIRCVSKDGEWADSVYVADGTPTKADAWPWQLKTLPAMFCPYGLSRISLEITNVRIERLHEISQDDAVAEGCDDIRDMKPLPGRVMYAGGPRAAYQVLWETIHGAGSWNLNPLVWVISFKRVTA